MSATGQGTTVIAGQNYAFLESQTLEAGETLVFTHTGPLAPNGPGRPAYSIVVTQGNLTAPGLDVGGDLSAPYSQLTPPIIVSQTANAISISNTNDANPLTIYTECKWLENSEEMDLQVYPDANGTIVIS